MYYMMFLFFLNVKRTSLDQGGSLVGLATVMLSMQEIIISSRPLLAFVNMPVVSSPYIGQLIIGHPLCSLLGQLVDTSSKSPDLKLCGQTPSQSKDKGGL